jgi:general secretion pathway protein G
MTKEKGQTGFSLVELVITISVLAVLTLTTVPLVQNAVQRDKEQRLRETLRQIRAAIDEFKRDTVGACQQGNIQSGNPIINSGDGRNPNFGGGFNAIAGDPRSRVIIADCKIFETENLDRYPPSLEILIEGVSVKPRGVPAGATSQGGSVFDQKNATDVASGETKETKKRYLREIPVDPITGKTDTWILRSSYQEKEDDTWDEVNVFDVRSGAEGEALNGQKYSEW